MFKRAVRLGTPAALQIVLQGISFVTTFLLIRALPIADFAIYNGFIVLSQTLITACDLGAISSIGYFYRKVEQHPERFAQYFRAVVQVRSLLFAVVAIILYPSFLFGSSFSHQVSALPVLVIITLVISLAQASYGTTTTALRFVSATGVTTALLFEIGASLARLSLIVLIIGLMKLGSAHVVLLITALVASVQGYVSWQALHRHIPKTVTQPAAAPRHRREVLAYVLPIVPGGLYHSFQPLLLTWLAAYHGGLRQIAEVGVLGRIGLMFGLLSFIVSFQIMPMLGRTTSRPEFMRVYLISAAGLLTLLLVALFGGFMFPSQIMSLAGAKYGSLYEYLPLALTAAVLTVIGGFAVSVLRLEGWNRFEPACTAFQVIGQLSWILLVPIGSTYSLILFSLFSATLYCLPYVLLNILGFLVPQIFKPASAAT